MENDPRRPAPPSIEFSINIFFEPFPYVTFKFSICRFKDKDDIYNILFINKFYLFNFVKLL